MATVNTVPDNYRMLIAFDDEAQVIWVRYADGSEYQQPIASFRTSSEPNVTLLKVQELSILIYDKPDGKGGTLNVMCPHVGCDRWC